ncbi:AraC family transcriptional regulator [Firmicutes bacterium AM55-24TS]|jgi:AraC-like DNA-binding protein|nr:AraC family transcriptional regulator [Firmicutes bacterium AM55-24TS]
MKRTAFSSHNDLYINYLKSENKHNMSVQHYHDTYEIYLQLSGKRYLFYDNTCYTLERGDLAIFAPFDIHYAESRESDYYERYVVNFRLEDMSKILDSGEFHLLKQKINPCVVHLTEDRTQKVFELIKRVDEYYNRKGLFSDKLVYLAMLQLFVYVAECIDDETATDGEKISPQIIEVMKYINKHYAEDLNLDNISDIACMSKYHLCRKFKEATGATLLQYINNVRLTKVHSMLINTDMPIEEIAECTGFSSSMQLTRVFKSVYNIPPRTFRKNQKVL